MKNIYLGMLFISLLCFSGCCSDDIDPEQSKFGTIPASAAIIFHIDKFIYVMDEDGGNITQITFENTYEFEHVALSFDRTKIIANYFSGAPGDSQTSKMVLFDLENDTTSPFLPEFEMAGNGGVDWDEHGYIYFAGVRELPFVNPATISEFQANAGANDIYRAKFDESALQNLTNTDTIGEADVSVSTDSQCISYMGTDITDSENTFTQIWKRNTDGTNPILLFTGGKDRTSSVHDPEISPDGNFVVFSQVNNLVPPVFPDNPLANTAHDIIKLNFSATSAPETVTQPGPISIAPDWKGDKILYLEITDKTNFPHAGLAIINTDGTGYRLLKNGTNIGKWIPK